MRENQWAADRTFGERGSQHQRPSAQQAGGPVVISSIMAAGERCGVAGETALVPASKQGPSAGTQPLSSAMPSPPQTPDAGPELWMRDGIFGRPW